MIFELHRAVLKLRNANRGEGLHLSFYHDIFIDHEAREMIGLVYAYLGLLDDFSYM